MNQHLRALQVSQTNQGIETFPVGPSPVYDVSTTSDLIDPEWDHFLATTPGGHHVQTSRWAQVKAELGWRACRVIIRRQGQIVAGAQLLFKSLPVAGSMGYVPKGPLCAQTDPTLAKLVLHHLNQAARSNWVQYLIVQPSDLDTVFTGLLTQQGFQPSSVDVGPTATVRIDLSQDLNTILARMKPKTRYNLRLGTRKGITVREGSPEDLPIFYQSLVATSQRQLFMPYAPTYFDTMARHLHPYGAFQLFVASYQDQPVSTLLAIPFGDTVIYKKGGWVGEHQHRHPNEVLHWTAIQWAKSRGYRYYDFEGIDPAVAQLTQQGRPLPEPLRQSVSRFKVGFGGEIVFLPTPYDYVYNAALRWTYQKVYPKIAHSALIGKLRELAHKR